MLGRQNRNNPDFRSSLPILLNWYGRRIRYYPHVDLRAAVALPARCASAALVTVGGDDETSVIRLARDGQLCCWPSLAARAWRRKTCRSGRRTTSTISRSLRRSTSTWTTWPDDQWSGYFFEYNKLFWSYTGERVTVGSPNVTSQFAEINLSYDQSAGRFGDDPPPPHQIHNTLERRAAEGRLRVRQPL